MKHHPKSNNGRFSKKQRKSCRSMQNKASLIGNRPPAEQAPHDIGALFRLAMKFRAAVKRLAA